MSKRSKPRYDFVNFTLLLLRTIQFNVNVSFCRHDGHIKISYITSRYNLIYKYIKCNGRKLVFVTNLATRAFVCTCLSTILRNPSRSSDLTASSS